MEPGFAVWLTGLPASGKSTIARALARLLVAAGCAVEILESDTLRKVLAPDATYSEEERDAFYGALAYVGALLVRHGVTVIFDATANRRRHRDRARERIERFVEVFVDCPLEVCATRDPKGIYRSARAGGASAVPGLQVPYEPPEQPDVVIHADREAPDEAARRILTRLRERSYLETGAR